MRRVDALHSKRHSGIRVLDLVSLVKHYVDEGVDHDALFVNSQSFVTNETDAVVLDHSVDDFLPHLTSRRRADSQPVKPDTSCEFRPSIA